MGQERVCGEAMGCGLLLGHQVVGDVKEGSRASREKALACSSDEEEEPIVVQALPSSTHVLHLLFSPLLSVLASQSQTGGIGIYNIFP